ncbi:unnamed protein product [Musa acuminata subsp. malaccensis]|uniref:(wild Malaysian banana) hypothetical protein n=1 Tax=Musa acuminata subsp. malaccensis TaxID=214687 RepID=A0A8D7B003_MUSAM|nr:unnamed protein product [Musa acuminata subsp. malaccensis]
MVSFRSGLQVCLACLLPLFFIPVVNALPLLFYFIVGKIYWLFGWEYRKPERVPPSCPYKPAVKKIVDGSSETVSSVEPQRSGTEGDKNE